MDTKLVLCLILVNIVVTRCQNQTAQTSAYPTVKGPTSLNDKIAIVGTGPAAIDIRDRFQRAGFKRLTMYEIRNYPGGNIVRSEYTPDRKAYEMGKYSTLLPKKFSETYHSWMEATDMMNQVVDATEAHVWTKDTTRMKFSDWVQSEVKKALNDDSLNQSQIISKIEADFDKLIKAEKDLFGEYEGFFPPKPAADKFSQLNKTFAEFLTDNGIKTLQPILKIFLAMNDYNDLKMIPAINGLANLSPSLLAEMKSNLKSGTFHIFKMMKNGLSAPLERLVRISNWDEDTEFYYDVYRVQQGPNNDLCLYYKKTQLNKRYKKCGFDHVVLAEDVRFLSFSNFSSSCMVDEWFDSGVQETPYGFRFVIRTNKTATKSIAGTEYYPFSNENGNASHQVQYCRNNDDWYPASKLSTTEQTSTCLVLSIDKNNTIARDREEAFVEFFDYMERVADFPLKDYLVSLKRTYMATKFPKDYFKVYHDIFEKQGSCKMWFVESLGATPCSSMECALDYNKRLWESYTVPTM